MEGIEELEVAVGRAEVFSQAALRLMERFLVFLAARDPALIQAFAQEVAATQLQPRPGSSIDEQELEATALDLERQVASGVLAALQRIGARRQH